MAQARRFTLWAHNSEVKMGCRYPNISPALKKLTWAQIPSLAQ